jgi:hypothetical protein
MMENKKVGGDFPAIRSLKVEPMIHPFIVTIRTFKMKKDIDWESRF